MSLQLLLPGRPDGAVRIGDALSTLDKEGRITYFVGGDNYFSHRESDMSSRRFILASLVDNGRVRACDLLFFCHRLAIATTSFVPTDFATARNVPL